MFSAKKKQSYNIFLFIRALFLIDSLFKSAENNLKSTKNDSKSTKKEEQSWSEDDEEWVLNKTEKTTIAEMTEFLRNTNLNFIPAPFTKGEYNSRPLH